MGDYSRKYNHFTSPLGTLVKTNAFCFALDPPMTVIMVSLCLNGVREVEIQLQNQNYENTCAT